MADHKVEFAAIPLQALADTRLTASHWRFLACIAWHDRFGANGVGCYAGNKTLSKESAVHYTNIARIAEDLEQWGYVLVKRHPLNRRLRVYSLNYKHNLTIVGEHTNNRAPQYGNGHASSDPSSEIGVVTNFGPPIVGEQNRQDHEFKQEGESKYIPLSGSLNESRESDALSCIEGWQLDSRAIADGIEDVLHDERLSSKSESTSSTDEHAGLFGVERQFSERLQAAAGDPKAQHEIMNEYRTWEAFSRPDDWEHGPEGRSKV